jgi:branched-subunit amino acid aminotransferase/4-amino-4-deoxychorismate lyase
VSGSSPADGPSHVWVDGRILPADGPHVSAFDRGFQLGDGIFETLRARGGRVTELDEHLARLGRSATGLDIDLPADIDDRVRAGIREILEIEGLAGPAADASVRITVTRGTFRGRGLLPPAAADPAGAMAPTVVIQAWPIAPPPPGHLADGLHLVASAIRRDPENPLATLKTISRADFVHARLEARRAGADDALFLTTDGHLSEGTSANVFLVRGDELATPDLGCAILPGTTRSWVLGWASRAGLRPVEDWLTTRELAEADEAFLCSSVAGILPVTTFEGRPIGSGRPGPVTLRARADREAFIRGEAPA